jgi:UDP-N-acetylglucosamine 2-epimerase (non-hydrolysing)
MPRRRVAAIIGTRPEAIKMAPVIREIERHPADFDLTVVATAQHRELLDQVLSLFRIRPDVDLALMEHNQGLADFAARSLVSLSKMLGELTPDAILVQGDTTTVVTAALAAFYLGVRVGHIEAGLRSFDRRNPFPEETNRRLAAVLVDMHFAPTERARLNLLSEGVPERDIFVTGNTVVDALGMVGLEGKFDEPALERIDFGGKKVLLVTAHRRESHGPRLSAICQALRSIASRFPDTEIVFPAHPNPNVSKIVREELGGSQRIRVIPPVSYSDLLKLMNRCYLVLTDSGGIQEEAPSFRKPVLVMREVTERPELIEAGAGKVIGTDAERIVTEVAHLVADPRKYEKMIAAQNPFGDGHAARRIVDILTERLDARLTR